MGEKKGEKRRTRGTEKKKGRKNKYVQEKNRKNCHQKEPTIPPRQ